MLYCLVMCFHFYGHYSKQPCSECTEFFLFNISSLSYCFECKKGGRQEIKQMVGSHFKLVNVEIFVISPIIAHRREYLLTRPLKSLPT